MLTSKWILAVLATTALAPFEARAAEAAGAGASGQPDPATASDEKTGSRVQEVVVTAERREANLQKVPVAVAAVTGAKLAAQNVQTSNDLIQLVPGLDIETSSGDTKIFLRGVGTTVPAVDNSVSLYLDGVYIAAQSASLLQFDDSVARVEVLKGPQGTLFGRNSDGGVIQVITKDPSERPSGSLSVGYGNYSTGQISLYGTGKIVDNLSANFSAFYRDQADGWGRNVTTGVETYKGDSLALHTKFLYAPSDATRVTFSADYEQDEQSTGMLEGILPGRLGVDGVTSYVGFYNAAGNINDHFTDKNWGTMLRVEHDFGWARAVSITGYRDSHNIHYLDSDDTPRHFADNFPLPIVDTTFSQELQLLSPKDSKLQWIAGLYYLDDLEEGDPEVERGLSFAPNLGLNVSFKLPTHSYAVFGQATYEILSKTHLTIGLRYTDDEKSITGHEEAIKPDGTSPTILADTLRNQFTKVTYRFALDRQITPDVMTYASYNRGFKSGQYSATFFNLPAARPETLDAYETGVKSELFDHRLRLNVSAFFYNYQDIQIGEKTGLGVIVTNAANAHIYGVDTDLSAVISDHLSVDGGMEWLDAHYNDFPNGPSYVPKGTGGNVLTFINESGFNTVLSPSFTGTIGPNYRTQTPLGELLLNVNYSYNSGFFWDPDNRLKQPAYGLLGSYVMLKLNDGKLDVRVWGNNLTGKKYFAQESANAFGDFFSPAAPTTYGVTLTAHF
jgi:iron complex outermembrane recepter protein